MVGMMYQWTTKLQGNIIIEELENQPMIDETVDEIVYEAVAN